MRRGQGDDDARPAGVEVEPGRRDDGRRDGGRRRSTSSASTSLPHLDDVPSAVGDVLSRVNLPAIGGRGALAGGPDAPAARARGRGRRGGRRRPARPRPARPTAEARPRRPRRPSRPPPTGGGGGGRREARGGGAAARAGRGAGGGGQDRRPRSRRRPRAPRRRRTRPRRSPRRPRTSRAPTTCPTRASRPSRSRRSARARGRHRSTTTPATTTAPRRPLRRRRPPRRSCRPRRPCRRRRRGVVEAAAGSGGGGDAAQALLKNANLVLDADAQKDIRDDAVDPRMIALLGKLTEKHKIELLGDQDRPRPVHLGRLGLQPLRRPRHRHRPRRRRDRQPRQPRRTRAGDGDRRDDRRPAPDRGRHAVGDRRARGSSPTAGTRTTCTSPSTASRPRASRRPPQRRPRSRRGGAPPHPGSPPRPRQPKPKPATRCSFRAVTAEDAAADEAQEGRLAGLHAVRQARAARRAGGRGRRGGPGRACPGTSPRSRTPTRATTRRRSRSRRGWPSRPQARGLPPRAAGHGLAGGVGDEEPQLRRRRLGRLLPDARRASGTRASTRATPRSPSCRSSGSSTRPRPSRQARVAAGKPIDDPNSFGEWIADVERPAEQYRGRYQLKLEEADDLLGAKARRARRDGGGAAGAGRPAGRPGAGRRLGDDRSDAVRRRGLRRAAERGDAGAAREQEHHLRRRRGLGPEGGQDRPARGGGADQAQPGPRAHDLLHVLGPLAR